jgi:hypothetical protein
MKHDFFTKAMAVLFLLSMVATSCNKEDDPPNPEELQDISFDAEVVLALVPDGLKNSDDQYAQDCYSFIESAVDMTSFIDNMEVPETATRSKAKSSGETWQWSWNYGGESFTFYWSYEERNSKRYWTMDIQFGSGPRYNYIDAWENMDGTQGELTYNFGWAAIYGGEEPEEAEFIYWRYTWEKNSAGGYNLSFIWDGDSEYEVYTRYDCVINANGSGTIDYYLMDELFYHMDWDVLGNGNWVYYIDGEEYMSGLWTV